MAELAAAPDLGSGTSSGPIGSCVGCWCADLHHSVLRFGLHAAALAHIGEGCKKFRTRH